MATTLVVIVTVALVLLTRVKNNLRAYRDWNDLGADNEDPEY
jgi:hypothetical protein